MSKELQSSLVERRSGLSLHEFKREYLYPGRPVVITNAIEDWTARSSWTFEYLKSRYGKTLVNVYRYEQGGYRADHLQQMRLADFIDRILSADWKSYPYYIRDDWKLFLLHKELLADYKVPDYFFDWFKVLPSFMRLIYPRIFIGPKGAVTPLHHDVWGTHAWLAQLVGRKRWVLFPCDQKKLLYNYKVNPDEPDLDQFPLFRKAKPLECTIGPGDIIYVPGGWSHQVTSLDPTISLTHNFMGPGCFVPALVSSVRERVLQRFKNVLGGGM